MAQRRGAEVPALGGTGFVHFSHVEGVSEYRELVPGEAGEVEIGDNDGQDGGRLRMSSVLTVREVVRTNAMGHQELVHDWLAWEEVVRRNLFQAFHHRQLWTETTGPRRKYRRRHPRRG